MGDRLGFAENNSRHDFARWDQQIAADADAGKMDGILVEARREYRAGMASPL